MKKHAVIIGAGLGGISAAIMLATRGFSVTICERNDKIGGKLNYLDIHGFHFDLGPSILTLPNIFRYLFEKAGRCMEDYFELQELDHHWRNFFEDGTTIDLFGDLDKTRENLGAVSPDMIGRFNRFYRYSKKQYELIERGYFRYGLDTALGFATHYSPFQILKDLDIFRTMDRSVTGFFGTGHIHDMFNYFIKYVGSSALDAPGFMNLMPYVQFGFGLWYVTGGMYSIARGFSRLLNELGVEVYTRCEVAEIRRKGKRVIGVSTQDNRQIDADVVISNMEVVPTCIHLLGRKEKDINKHRQYEPSCSGLVIHLGIRKHYSQLRHHNFFHAADQRKHFHQVFQKKELPDDPTIYLVAPTVTDPSRAPKQHHILKILPHIPHRTESHPYTLGDYRRLREKVFDKLERMGLSDLRNQIVVEHMLTPVDIEDLYRSYRGSIYGTVSDRKLNFALKAPKKSREYRGLYFVGGTVNPGSGMPMALLGGQKTAQRVIGDFTQE
ncbi:MAG: phytoene desaturase family protein [Chitinivibrionales bacterium]